MEGVRINSTVSTALHARAVVIARRHRRTIGSLAAYGLDLAVRAIEKDEDLAELLTEASAGRRPRAQKRRKR